MQVKANDRAGMIPGIIVGASAAGIVLSARWLPAEVAWYFNFSGAPGAYAARGLYLAVMLVLTVGVPVAVRFSLVAWLRDRADALMIPNRDYWLAPAQREVTLAYLKRQTAWMAAAVAVVILVGHLLDVRANRFDPPFQPPLEFLRYVVGVALACLIWAGCIARHFRKP